MKEEYLDILDEQGNKTGRIKSRNQVHQDGDWHRVVHVWIYNSRGEILLQRRSITKDCNAGMLDISSAGHLLAGETSIEGAIREINEELGLCILESELQFIKTFQTRKEHSSSFINCEFSDIYLLKIDKELKCFALQKEEISDIYFISYLEFKRMVAQKQPDLVMRREEFDVLFSFLDSRIS